MEGVCIPLHSSPDANLRFFVSSPSDSEMVFVLASQHQGSSLVFPKAVWRTDVQSAENWHLLLSGLETNSAGRQEVVGLAPNNHTGHFHMERPRDLHGGRKKKKNHPKAEWNQGSDPSIWQWAQAAETSRTLF